MKAVPFEIAKSEGFVAVKLSGDLTPESASSFAAALPKLLEEPHSHVLLNCEALTDMAQAWIRPLMQLNRDLKSVGKLMRMVSVPAGVQRMLKENGVSGALSVSPTVKAAMSDFGLAASRALDVNFVNPFLAATMAALKIQAATEARPGKIYTKPAHENYLGDISGVIGLVSEAFSGAVVISFPSATFLKIMSRMLGSEYQAIDQELADGAGELVNIIFGQAKLVLNENGYGIETALPSVVTGKEHSVQSMTLGPRIVVPFETDAGGFFIEVCLSA